MRAHSAVLLLLLLPLRPGLAAAEPSGPVWDACFQARDAAPDFWFGWRRDLGGGYGDFFQFYARVEGEASLLEATYFIDGIVRLDETMCFGPDGALAGLFSRMHSPNVAGAPDAPPIERRARIEFGPDAEMLSMTLEILQAGEPVASEEDERFELARPCSPSRIYLDVEEVGLRLQSELGDITGDRPPYEPRELDWCGLSGDPDSLGD